ncbi:MAG: glycosyltransferase family 2 protein [Anaerolineales bacterium]
MKASVIILTWNGIDYIAACLDAVLAQDYADFEVIVVDNASSDGTADFVAAHYPQVQLIRNERNLGFAAGNNIGMRAATGDVLALLNQDTEVHPGWLAALVEMAIKPDVGIAGCKLLYPDGAIQHAGGRIVDARGSARHIGRGEVDAAQYDAVQDVDFVTGAALALTRATLTRIGPLDEAFSPAYYEDADWCYRARAAGLRVVVCPQAVATHYESVSSEIEGYAHLANFHAGRLRFLFKHQSLADLQASFLHAESNGVRNLGPGGELEALRQALARVGLALPEIVQFRTRHLEPPADAQTVGQALLDIILKLRELCAKEQPAYAVRDHLDATESRAVGTELVEQAAQSEAPTGDETMAALHEKWRIEPQPFQSEAPIVGPGIAAFREAWISIATRWYVEPLITQQRAFNAVVTQALDREVDKLNRVSISQVELLHLVRQLSDNVERAQQENAQHVRELNTLLSEVLRLQTRVAELETQLEAQSEDK